MTDGARGRTWTGKDFTPQDFKSCAYTDFATRAEVVTRTGLEPVAPWLKVKCSTTELAGHLFWKVSESGWGRWIRTIACQSQSLMPYRLAMPQARHVTYHISKHMLCFDLRKWWARVDSNRRRRKSTDLQSAAFGHFATRPSNFFAEKWWMLRGSNPWPPPCKGDALPLS